MEYDASSPLRGDSPEGGSGDELIVGWRAVSKGVATNGEFWETERFLGVCLSIYHGETRKEITPFLYGLVAGHCHVILLFITSILSLVLCVLGWQWVRLGVDEL